MSSSIYESLIEKGVLVSPEILEKKFDSKLIEKVADFFGDDLDVLDEELIINFKKKLKKDTESRVKIIKDYVKEPKKREFSDFVKMFNNRFKQLSSILQNRQELQRLTSLARLKNKSSNEKISIIAMVLDKNYTKNNNIILSVEDPTGIATVVVRKEGDKDLYDLANDIVLDEVIGLSGTWLNTALFPDNIYFPDVPVSKELKKQEQDEYVIFMGDTHFGSNVFMKQEFSKFLKWLKGEIGDEVQKEIANKVKYIIMTGDIIEGAGIYPNQEHDLEIIDAKQQYEEAAKWIRQIPEHIEIISTTGNHDTGRISEPQEKPKKDMAKSLYEIPNLRLVSNPSYINIASKNGFPGFDILLYHGGSLIYYSENIPSIRAAGGQKRVDLIMKFYLQRRHLAPTHGSTLIIPDVEEDYLLIDEVPDFLVTGHIHRASASNYRNVTLLNTSTWTETTEDQIKRGLEPQPARIVLTNLRTRKVKIMNFMSKKQKEKEQEKLKHEQSK